jgi:GNAT superfamily N-acetyltransferase
MLEVLRFSGARAGTHEGIMAENRKADRVIRPLQASDEPEWRRLWAGYLAFYRQALSRETTEATWQALIDPGRPEMIGRVGEVEGRAAGMLNAVIHPNTWSIAPVCYLEDLFVDPEHRGRGMGRALIEALAAEARRAGWRRIYWRTADDNLTAQLLYDRVARCSRWVTYELDVS